MTPSPDDVVATPISDVADLSPKAREEYWRLIVTTLETVFGLSSQEASAKVAELRRRIEEQPGPTQLVAYHFEPLQVAADLAGASDRSLTPAERRAYVKIRPGDDPDVPGLESTDRLFPDDVSAAAAE